MLFWLQGLQHLLLALLKQFIFGLSYSGSIDHHIGGFGGRKNDTHILCVFQLRFSEGKVVEGKVISDRSEKSSTIVTTNLPFSKWTELFENTTMVAALIDRLTFRSHVLDMNGDSYRLKATMQKRA